jgi:cyclophilin family peptidyl-prolyl cis-trans isomerase
VQSQPSSKPTTGPSSQPASAPVVVIETSMGDITVELFPDKAPKSVANFLKYADDGFFAGTIFHRVIPGFMVQGGGFSAKMQQKPTNAAIVNEARADVKNLRGTLAMARTGQVDSATAQFFISVKDNDFLDHKDETARGFGYAVFGKVVSGMDVVDKIVAVKTGNYGQFENVPVEAVEIKAVRRAAAK